MPTKKPQKGCGRTRANECGHAHHTTIIETSAAALFLSMIFAFTLIVLLVILVVLGFPDHLAPQP